MTFRRRVQLDPRQVRDLRGRRPGRGMAILGGGGSIGAIVIVIFVLLGGDVGTLLGGEGLAPQARGPQGSVSIDDCDTGADANQRRDCRAVGFVNSVQLFWEREFAAAELRYEAAATTLFSGSVDTACGFATAATGPFYCPRDSAVYLDLTFFDDLRTVLGADGGPLAEGYVIAHEYGHHVQHLLGALAGADRSAGTGGGSVRIELQADCFAGAWTANAAESGYLEVPTAAQVADSLDAAAAVGDDSIQQRTQGQVDSHRWTHGSSSQRQEAFTRGYDAEDPGACQRAYPT